jgi:biofilm PGA synthesis protein PgaD
MPLSFGFTRCCRRLVFLQGCAWWATRRDALQPNLTEDFMQPANSPNAIEKFPVIERSDLQSPRQKTVYGALTFVFWGLWFYLWLPLLALLAWALGVQQAYKYMVLFGGYHDVIALLGMYAVVILILCGALLAWATYNILRFRGVERRTVPIPVSLAQIRHAFGGDKSSVERWQGEQRMFVTHDGDGRITSVDSTAARQVRPA